MKQRFTSKQTSINSIKAPAVSIYDPFNRTPEHNAAVLAGSYDVAVISNVLNVIDSEAADSWQENRRTADYMDEIAAALPGWNVARFGRLIQATQKR